MGFSFLFAATGGFHREVEEMGKEELTVLTGPGPVKDSRDGSTGTPLKVNPDFLEDLLIFPRKSA